MTVRFLGQLICLGITLAAQAQKPSLTDETVGDGIKALQSWYVPATGLYQTTGWWNAANATTVLVDYSRLTGSRDYLPILSNTFTAAQRKFPGFLNTYYDDEGWWALAWIAAFDLTHEARYLAAADTIFTDMSAGWDSTCGGGIWWSKDRNYKNAIANELFLSVATHLAARAPNPAKRSSYAQWAAKEWQWFSASGMINGQHLVNDGLDLKTCKNNGKTTWTYNQGVLLGALAENSGTYPADPDRLSAANAIAAAAITHLSDPQVILHDTCEPDCGEDGVQFKGIFIRNLLDLHRASPNQRYITFLNANAQSILLNSQGPGTQFGQVWSGPFGKSNAAIQASALDALIAALTATHSDSTAATTTKAP